MTITGCLYDPNCFHRYNASEHPIPFHKAQDLGKAPKKLAAEPAPDLEEAYDVSPKICIAFLVLIRILLDG